MVLKKYSISFSSQYESVPKYTLSKQSQVKIKKCFERLYKIVQKHKLKLRKVFDDFDKKKIGKLTIDQFIYMMNKLDSSMPKDIILEAFNLIDEDKSNTIQFDEFNNYYCKINGVPTYFTSESPQIPIHFKIKHQNTYPPPQVHSEQNIKYNRA